MKYVFTLILSCLFVLPLSAQEAEKSDTSTSEENSTQSNKDTSGEMVTSIIHEGVEYYMIDIPPAPEYTIPDGWNAYEEIPENYKAIADYVFEIYGGNNFYFWKPDVDNGVIISFAPYEKYNKFKDVYPYTSGSYSDKVGSKLSIGDLTLRVKEIDDGRQIFSTSLPSKLDLETLLPWVNGILSFYSEYEVTSANGIYDPETNTITKASFEVSDVKVKDGVWKQTVMTVKKLKLDIFSEKNDNNELSYLYSVNGEDLKILDPMIEMQIPYWSSKTFNVGIKFDEVPSDVSELMNSILKVNRKTWTKEKLAGFDKLFKGITVFGDLQNNTHGYSYKDSGNSVGDSGVKIDFGRVFFNVSFNSSDGKSFSMDSLFNVKTESEKIATSAKVENAIAPRDIYIKTEVSEGDLDMSAFLESWTNYEMSSAFDLFSNGFTSLRRGLSDSSGKINFSDMKIFGDYWALDGTGYLMVNPGELADSISYLSKFELAGYGMEETIGFISRAYRGRDRDMGALFRFLRDVGDDNKRLLRKTKSPFAYEVKKTSTGDWSINGMGTTSIALKLGIEFLTGKK